MCGEQEKEERWMNVYIKGDWEKKKEAQKRIKTGKNKYNIIEWIWRQNGLEVRKIVYG